MLNMKNFRRQDSFPFFSFNDRIAKIVFVHFTINAEFTLRFLGIILYEHIEMKLNINKADRTRKGKSSFSNYKSNQEVKFYFEAI